MLCEERSLIMAQCWYHLDEHFPHRIEYEPITLMTILFYCDTTLGFKASDAEPSHVVLMRDEGNKSIR